MTARLRVAVALRILEVWYDSATFALAFDGKLGPRYSLRWQTVGLINHDRVLTGSRALLYLNTLPMKKPTV